MKKIIIPVLSTFIYFHANAESNFEPVHFLNDTFLLKNNIRDSNSIKNYILDLNPGNKLLFSNERGNVFSLAPDNMYCLVPLDLQNMPVLKNLDLPFIPNPFSTGEKNTPIIIKPGIK